MTQGKDASFGIGLMESDKRFSATLKNFYVQISRAVHGMTLVTDNKDKLIQSINKNNDEKSSAIDMVSGKQLIQHSLAFERQSKINIQSIIDKKINEERQVLQNKISPNLSENNSNIDKQLTYLKDKKIEEKMIKKDEKIKEIEF